MANRSEFSQQVHFSWILPWFQTFDVAYILAGYPVFLTQEKQSSSFSVKQVLASGSQ